MNPPRKIALLLGAGFSYDLGMPLAHELTEVLLRPFTERDVKQLVSAMARGRPHGPNRPPNERALAGCLELLLDFKSTNGQNYEIMLVQLEGLAKRYDVSQSDRDSAHYVLARLYELIHDILSLYQAASYELCYPPNLRWYSTLGNVLSSEETWVFSLNHDLFVECLAIDLKIPISYGDVETKEFPVSNLEMQERVQFSCIERPRYSIDSPRFIRDRPGINLVKLHGGLSEYDHDYDDKKIICNLDLNRPSSQALLAEYERVARMATTKTGLRRQPR